MTASSPHILKTNCSTEYYFDEGCFILELSNSEQDPYLSIARARVLPNTATKLHKLNETIERYIILEGTGEVTLGNEEPQKVDINDVVIIPKNCPQKIHNTGSIDLIFLVLCTPRFLVENYSDC